MVCAYNRAGVGDSDPATTRLPRSLEELVTDLNTFADATHARSPYLLAGQSMGANIVFRYAQRYPGKVAGFVAMNPVPPEHTYLSRVRSVESRDEYAAELAFYRGENDERVDFATSEKQLTEPLPKTLRFTVMFDEDCDGDTEFCGRILPVLTRTTRELAWRGAKGTFVPAPGAGHQIYAEQPQLVADTVDSLLSKH